MITFAPYMPRILREVINMWNPHNHFFKINFKSDLIAKTPRDPIGKQSYGITIPPFINNFKVGEDTALKRYKDQHPPINMDIYFNLFSTPQPNTLKSKYIPQRLLYVTRVDKPLCNIQQIYAAP
jgi:hypothetical protein